ncbi:hypothetical protein [Marinifilum fragile]|uniref:hypothetical protein n=1 Tax=Marinifilum fragile TaxID=570161 RepID=UPI002AAAEC69|nr:hypothetical protein [Marinifilum fragile]
MNDLLDITEKELEEINGGGFGYDVGWAIRFLWNAGPNMQNLGYAMADYELNYKPAN